MRLRSLAIVLASFSVLLAVASRGGPAPSEAAASSPEEALERAGIALGANVQRRSLPSTGNVGFLRAGNGEILVADDVSRPPAERALEFLALYGEGLGLSERDRQSLGTDVSVLDVVRVDVDELGIAHVRLRQRHEGIPVFGAELVVHLGADGVIGVNGEYVPDVSAPAEPSIAMREALAIASADAVSRAGEAVQAVGASLAVWRSGLVERTAGPTVLTWSVEVLGRTLHERVFVDAVSGVIELRLPLRHDDLYRIIHSPEYVPEDPELFVQRREGDPPHLVPAINNLYDFAGHTYDLYASAFGRDSFDGQGGIMRSVYLVNGNCPNAYWNGSTTNYCPGFDTDDIVSHEWTHGYTQHTHGLIYAWQPGALNESYSDVFGEAVDLLNAVDGIGGSNNAAPFPAGQRWLVGEDMGQVAQEVLLRDMWNPERLGDPAKVSSTRYRCSTSDAGGVHTNSGVPNHAFAMLVDGKTFNGQTVEAIGLTKAANVYFRAMAYYQTPTSDFADHADALEAACDDLVGHPLTALSTSSAARVPAGETITASDCEQVAKAMLAVEMRTPPVQCNFQPQLAKNPPARCAGAVSLFREDFESGDAAWTKESVGMWPEWPGYTWTTRASLPEGRAGSAAFALNDRGGTCAPGGEHTGRYSSTSPEIPIPAGATSPQVRFDHYIETELGYDGGNLRVSVNGGAWTVVPQDRFLYNAPKSRLNPAPPLGQNTNPKAGEWAWHGADAGQVTGSWGTTVVSLSGIAAPGDRVRLQLDFGIDGCNGVTGWFVDDVDVYDCSGTLTAPPTASFTHSPASPREDEAVLFDGSASADGDSGAIASWTWDFGDGSDAVTAFVPEVEHTFASAGSYTVTLTVTDDDGEQGSTSRVVEVQAGPQLAELSVSVISLEEIKHGARIVATVVNGGNAAAPATRTEFRLDGGAVLGVVDTPSIPAGGSATVSVDFDARGRNGTHEISVTADAALQAVESDETNNTTSRTVEVRGTRVK